MDVNKILKADFLDLLFDGRNKAYGAYALRRSYNKRLTISIASMLAIALLIFLGSVISKEAAKNKKAQVEGRNDYLVVALKKLLEAVQFMEEPDIYEHVGDVHYSLGDWDKAVKAWEKAMALYRQALTSETKIEDIAIKLEKTKRLISVEKRGTRFIENRRGVGNSIQP